MSVLAPRFSSLRVRNFRLYFIGQSVSTTGTWMQRLAQEWLVLELTGSGSWLGFVAGLQFLPFLLLGPYAGLMADRVDKRRLMIVAQACSAAFALVLGGLTLVDAVNIWWVASLALGLGIVTALDNPARQSFVIEMVGDDDLPNAVALNSTAFNASRAAGPAIAGFLIATVGIGWSFLCNAASFVVMMVALVRMDAATIRAVAPTPRARGQLHAGLEHIRSRPVLRDTLVLTAVTGMLAYEYSVTLPLLARYSLGGNAATLGLLNTAMGIGAVVGGLASTGNRQPTAQQLRTSAAWFGMGHLATAVMPSVELALAALVVTGAASIRFLVVGSALLQLRAGPEFRGRVMAMRGIAFFGTTPVGAPIIGVIGEHLGARWAVAAGGAATLAVLAVLRVQREPPPDTRGLAVKAGSSDAPATDASARGDPA